MDYQHITVMGTGAVGGYFGGLIDKYTDSEVTFIARGKHLEAIKRNGLKISSINDDFTSRAKATNDVSDINAADLILFTVKSYDTEEAIDKIRPLTGKHTQILSIQNGLENHEKLEKTFGRDRVIRGFCVIGAELTQPGHIAHRALGSITVGEMDGNNKTERLKALKQLFEPVPAGLDEADDIQYSIWKKLAWNCVYNVLTGLTEVTVEKLFSTRATRQLVDDAYEEITQVAAAEGIEFTSEDYEKIISHGKSLKGFRTSTLQDVEKGKPLEFEGLTGSLMRKAEEHDIKLPVNNTLYALFQLRNQ